MKTTIALDIYGTLIDPISIKSALVRHAGEQAGAMAEAWRTKQLEYSFRRSLMKAYRNFSSVTRASLDYACQVYGIDISETDKAALMDLYRTLDAFSDTAPALAKLVEKGAELHAFSNGENDVIAALLEHAGIEERITSIVSADTIETFKPDPRVYAHFLDATRSDSATTWLVSSNPFDIIGAAACGWNTAWVKRNPTVVFDPWDHEPTAIISDLNELVTLPALWGAGS